MPDGSHELLKDLLFEVSETPPAGRGPLVDSICEQHPELASTFRPLVRGLDRADAQGCWMEDGETPERIGRYRIVRLLARGGMGEVYLGAEPEPMERLVAVKVIRRGLASRSMVRRFEFERDALKALEHPSIARIVDGGQTQEGLPFIAIEFVDGPSLKDYADAHSLSLPERLDLLRTVCHGVSAAHLRGLVHRDLKPGNILVHESDRGPAPKIIDFGIATLVDPLLGTARRKTAPGTPIGTLEYMSPEQAWGSLSRVDQRSDIYSLGVLLYELASGALPRTREQVLALADSNSTDVFERTRIRPLSSLLTDPASVHAASPGRLRGRLKELDWVAAQALETDPARRYQSVSDFCRDLDGLLVGTGVRAAPPSVFYRARKFVRRNALVSLGVALTVIGSSAVALTATFSEFRVSRALTESQAALEEKRAALAEKEAALADANAATRFLSNMLEAASGYEAPHGMTVEEMVDSAAPRIASELADAPMARWRVRTILADTYHLRGDHARALELIDGAERDAFDAWGPESVQTAEVIRVRGLILQAAGSLPEARACTERSLRLLNAFPDQYQTIRLTARDTLANILMDMQRFGEAAALIEESIAAWDRVRPGSDASIYPRVLSARCKSRLGDYEGALVHLDEATEILDRMESTWPHSVTNVLDCRAHIARMNGDVAAGLEASSALYEHLAEWYGHTDRRVLESRIMELEFMLDCGRPPSTVLDGYSGVLDQLPDLPENRSLELRGLYGFSRACLAMGDLDQAHTVLREAAGICGSETAPPDQERAQVHFLLALVCYSEGDLARARRALDISVANDSGKLRNQIEALRSELAF